MGDQRHDLKAKDTVRGNVEGREKIFLKLSVLLLGVLVEGQSPIVCDGSGIHKRASIKTVRSYTIVIANIMRSLAHCSSFS